MGSPCLFTRQQALKMGYIYWLRIKNSNHLHSELSVCYLEDAKFYPCSFMRKGEFISRSSLVWGKSRMFCTCTRLCAPASEAKIVRSRDAQCNTKELPWGKVVHVHGQRSSFTVFWSRTKLRLHWRKPENSSLFLLLYYRMVSLRVWIKKKITQINHKGHWQSHEPITKDTDNPVNQS